MTETSKPAGSGSPLIIHLQEAHTNYESQRHVIEILQRLVDQRGVRLILVEGGSGDVGLSYMRAYGSPANRKEVAEKYLKLGILTAEEYLDIVSDQPLTLWGVERDDLYRQNVDAFMDVEALQAAATPILASLGEAVEALKPVVHGQALLELEAKGKAFEEEQLRLAAYGEFLSRLASGQNIPVSEFPELSRFLDVRRMEQELKLDQVQKDQQALLEQLSARITQAQFDELVAQARQMKAGALKPETFYAGLETLAGTAGVKLQAEHPSLFLYMRYVADGARVAPTALSDELEQLAKRLRGSFASDPGSRQLIVIDEQLELVRKLVGLELAPEEHRTLQAVPLDGLCAGWERALNGLLAQHGQPARAFGQLDALQSMLPTMQRFYEAASDRDQALVENSLAKVRESGAQTAVLITGGFHSPSITRMLKQRGAGVVVVAPRISQATDEQLYRAVVKYKSGRGSFEDVTAVANRTASPAQQPAR